MCDQQKKSKWEREVIGKMKFYSYPFNCSRQILIIHKRNVV